MYVPARVSPKDARRLKFVASVNQIREDNPRIKGIQPLLSSFDKNEKLMARQAADDEDRAFFKRMRDRANALPGVTGSGKRKPAYLRKGTPAAKAHMSRLRAMRQ